MCCEFLGQLEGVRAASHLTPGKAAGYQGQELNEKENCSSQVSPAHSRAARSVLPGGSTENIPTLLFFLLFLVSWRAVTSLWVRAAVFPDCSWGGVTSVRGAHLAARSTTQGKAESGTA